MVGITEAAIFTAALLAARFTIITLPPRTIVHARRVVHEYGFETRVARIRAIEVEVADAATDEAALLRPMIDEARLALRDDGAEAIVLGCAGVAGLVAPMSAALGVPVVDGVTAAVKMVEGLVDARPSDQQALELRLSAQTPVAGRGPPLRGGAKGTVTRMATTLIRNAWIWRGEATSPEPRPESILVEGNRIVAVGPDLADGAAIAETVIDAAGMLAMPGLINAHFHSPVNHMKGRLPSLPLEIFMLYESPSLEVLKPSPREAYVRTMLACLEMLRGGVTAVQDDAFFVPHPEPEIIDAVMQAYADCGIRARVALDQSDLPEIVKLPYLAAMLPAAGKAELSRPPDFAASDLLAAYDHLIGRWHGHDGGRLESRRLLLRAAARDGRLFPRARRAVAPPRSSLLHPYPRNQGAARPRSRALRWPLTCPLRRRPRASVGSHEHYPCDLGR